MTICKLVMKKGGYKVLFVKLVIKTPNLQVKKRRQSSLYNHLQQPFTTTIPTNI